MAAMDIKTLQRYDAPVPRYTSYPTAPHFHPGVGAATYRAWLGQIGGEETVSLYLHVPYCDKLCWYCGCHTKVVRQYAPIADYAALVRREAALVAEAIPSRPRVTHVHWGGGTPTMLSAEDFARLMAALRAGFRFDPEAEVAVEIDPRVLTEAKVAALADSGVTRASLGVQDLNPEVQEAVNRVQPYELVARAVDWLRKAGIRGINFDLMYGLPQQTVERVLDSVDQALALGPDRVALFGYAHVPWMKTHQRLIDEQALPDGEARWRQAEAAAARLVEAGYRRIGLDHFARREDPMTRALDEGRLRRNFQGYTDDPADVLLGFGASSIGALPQGYVQNAVPFKAYGDAIRDGELAVTRGLQLDNDDRLRRAVIERLMCDLEVDLDEVAVGFGAAGADFAAELQALAAMERDGLVEVTGGTLRIPEPARTLMRTVCAVFDRYLASGAARHSRAV